MRELTAQENKVLQASKELWEQFQKLQSAEPMINHMEDQSDMLHHVNAIQNMIFARPAIQSQQK